MEVVSQLKNSNPRGLSLLLQVVILTPTCYSTTSFELFVLLVQPLDMLPPVFVCGSYTLPPLVNGFYYEGTKGTLRQFFEGDIITPLTIPSPKNIVTIFIFDVE